MYRPPVIAHTVYNLADRSMDMNTKIPDFIQPYLWCTVWLGAGMVIFWVLQPYLSMASLLLAVGAMTVMSLVLVLVYGHRYGQQAKQQRRTAMYCQAALFIAIVMGVLSLLPLGSQLPWTALLVYTCGMIAGWWQHRCTATEAH